MIGCSTLVMDGRDCNLGGRGEEVGNGKTTIIKYARCDEGGQFCCCWNHPLSNLKFLLYDVEWLSSSTDNN